MPKEIKVISFSDINRIIREEESIPQKEVLFIVRRDVKNTCKDLDSITEEEISNIVDINLKAEEVAGERAIALDLPDLLDAIGDRTEAYTKVIHICYPKEDDSE